MEFHRWLYKRYINDFELSSDFEVHHIDDDKINNFLCNLISLERKDHKKVHEIHRKSNNSIEEALVKVLEDNKDKYFNFKHHKKIYNLLKKRN